MCSIIVCKDYFQLETLKKKRVYGYICSNNDRNSQNCCDKFFNNVKNMFTSKSPKNYDGFEELQ